MIQCQYYLRVKAYYKVLMGCGTGPTLFLPFYLIPAPDEPVVLNYSPSFVIPEGAETISLTAHPINLDHSAHSIISSTASIKSLCPSSKQSYHLY